ncbi:hypothetical protein [Brachybacterium hainanense]|uniref:Uncharacterized protein n=1 Tax=Brachybacterium hainanense TaxID=1541174 RepID=A0ABV6R9R2_9MICO
MTENTSAGQALYTLGTQVTTRIGELRQPAAGSELEHLHSLHPDSPITAATSIAAAITTAAAAASATGFLVEVEDSPADETVLGGLARQLLIGVYTASYVLGPKDPAVREERARTLVTLEYKSYRQAASRVANFKGPEMSDARELAVERLTEIAKAKELNGIGSAELGTGKLLSEGAKEFAEFQLDSFRREDGADVELLDRIALNVHESAEWLWQTSSGFAHGYDWPMMLVGEEDAPNQSSQLFHALTAACKLSWQAAELDRASFRSE